MLESLVGTVGSFGELLAGLTAYSCIIAEMKSVTIELMKGFSAIEVSINLQLPGAYRPPKLQLTRGYFYIMRLLPEEAHSIAAKIVGFKNLLGAHGSSWHKNSWEWAEVVSS